MATHKNTSNCVNSSFAICILRRKRRREKEITAKRSQNNKMKINKSLSFSLSLPPSLCSADGQSTHNTSGRCPVVFTAIHLDHDDTWQGIATTSPKWVNYVKKKRWQPNLDCESFPFLLLRCEMIGQHKLCAHFYFGERKTKDRTEKKRSIKMSGGEWRWGVERWNDKFIVRMATACR